MLVSRNSNERGAIGVSAVAVFTILSSFSEALDLQSNILLGTCDEYFTLISRHELCMFFHEGQGEVSVNN